MAMLKQTLLSCLLLVFSLGMLSPASAITGNSTPNFDFETQTIRIPRIDVEGYGSLDLYLYLEDDIELTFSVSDALPANPELTPGATFDLQSQELNIPLLQVGTDFYAVKMGMAGEMLQITSADEAEIVGQQNYEEQCSVCHGADGLGGTVAVPMVNCATCASLDVLTVYTNNTMPLGTPFNCVDECAAEVADYILNVFNEVDSPVVTQALEAIESMPLDDTLRKASLQLVGRLPTAAEVDLVTDAGEEGLRSALNGMMDEQAFYDCLAEIFNDLLLTNRYLSSNGPQPAINLMRRFPNASWFDPGTDARDAEFQFNRTTTNDAVATEPLQLVNYVVKNDLPITEILTADYFMVNGYSAKSYGVEDTVAFEDEWDATEFVPAQLPGIPHAGILTSLMFLNRYPTSDTNVNRGRSRIVYDLFLDVDILALDGVRPDGSAVDITSTTPTLDNEDCIACHNLLDPVASSFQNWNRRGAYTPNAPWYDDIFQAGFAGVDRPDEEQVTSLQWLSNEMVVDSRFDNAMTRILYLGLTGSEPLDPPGEFATDAETDAYITESTHLEELTAAYIADNRNLKTLITEIIGSPYWRADELTEESFALVHEETGSARLLTPELLHRKIEAVLGFQWRGVLDRYSVNIDIDRTARLLDNQLFYNQIYGGIDSFSITERLVEPNGLMVSVQERMANELACFAVPNDFLAVSENRLLFPFVEATTQPNDAQSEAAIRSNIQYLHDHLLGEELSFSDPEIDFSFELFLDVLQQGQSSVGVTEPRTLPNLCMRNLDLETGAPLDEPLRDDPDYVMRSWMAVVAYLLSDYRFIFE
jgi:hypothetical protein|tara:strand:- start:118 stop:2571 length:2454 start_codon:yes stop_codon:yes gene_type:complete